MFSKYQTDVEKMDLDTFGRCTLKGKQTVDTKLQKWRIWLDIKEKKKIMTVPIKHRNRFHKVTVQCPSLEILKTGEDKVLYFEQPDLVWTPALLEQGFRLPKFCPT